MCDRDEGDAVLGALREGLRALPVPEPSPGFDERVLAALGRQPGLLERLRSALYPAVVGAAASCALMLIFAQCLLQTPPSVGSAHLVTTRVPAGAMAALDRLLDDPAAAHLTLTRLTLCGGWAQVLRGAAEAPSREDGRAGGPRSDTGAVNAVIA